MNITIEQPPNVNAGSDDMVCLDTNGIQLNGYVYGASQFYWEGGNGTYIPNTFNTDARYIPTQAEIDSGTVSLQLITDNEICPNTSDEVSFQLVQIIIDTNNTDVSCYGQDDGEIQVQIDGNSSGYELTWWNATNDLNLNNLSAGSYCGIISENYGCIMDFCIDIAEPDLLTVDIDKTDVSCNGIDLGIASAVPTGGTEPYSYSWNNSMHSQTIDNISEGNYSVTVTDYNSCTTFGNTEIGVIAKPSAEFYQDTYSGCEPLTVSYSETGNNDNCSYAWYVNENLSSTERNPELIFDNEGTYNITLTVTSDMGCDSSIAAENPVIVYPKPESEFWYDPLTTNIFEPEINFYSQDSEDALQFYWFCDNDLFSIEKNSTFSFENSGVFEVEHVVVNEYFCTDTASKEILISEPQTLWIPNAITPDKPDENGIFKPKYNAVEPNNYKLIIFDRWGMKVFETTNIKKGWNGRNKNGKVYPIGVYSWIIQYKNSEKKITTQTGYLTLIR